MGGVTWLGWVADGGRGGDIFINEEGKHIEHCTSKNGVVYVEGGVQVCVMCVTQLPNASTTDCRSSETFRS